MFLGRWSTYQCLVMDVSCDGSDGSCRSPFCFIRGVMFPVLRDFLVGISVYLFVDMIDSRNTLI